MGIPMGGQSGALTDLAPYTRIKLSLENIVRLPN